MELSTLTIAQLFQVFGVPVPYVTAIIITLILIKFFGKRLFKNIIEEIVTEHYNNSLRKDTDKIIDLKISLSENTIKEEILDNVGDIIESHTVKCKNSNMEINDQRYLMRQEFRMYMESQAKVTERLESAVLDLRNVCNQILLKLTD